jgi:hypothetical protein
MPPVVFGTPWYSEFALASDDRPLSEQSLGRECQEKEMSWERPVFKAKVNHAGKGEVFIDDKDISDAVTSFEVIADVSQVTEVKLTLLATQLDLEIEGVIESKTIGETSDGHDNEPS